MLPPRIVRFSTIECEFETQPSPDPIPAPLKSPELVTEIVPPAIVRLFTMDIPPFPPPAPIPVLNVVAVTEMSPPRIVRFFTVVFVDVEVPIPEPYQPETVAVIDPPATVSSFTRAPVLAPIAAPDAT
jgi:hypothetical protein